MHSIYMVNSVNFYSAPCYAHAWLLKGRGLCTAMYVPCKTVINVTPKQKIEFSFQSTTDTKNHNKIKHQFCKCNNCNSIVAFTTNWKYDVAVFTVYSVLMNVNDLLTLTHFDIFQLDINFKYTYHISADSVLNSWIQTGNDVSKFTHSNCIMLSYYSSPKHKESAS